MSGQEGRQVKISTDTMVRHLLKQTGTKIFHKKLRGKRKFISQKSLKS